ncbi:hypothetical protein HHI36_003130 [Cryptolaemus montrouzieri]|uniref:Uncharacterized protein n=1 Tax=Cryptolaemus montrouzieri TaxID=559131 RepID=A0ABD2PDH2_9CUCU
MIATVANAAFLSTGQIVSEGEVPAHYKFQYQVDDPATGDQKHQEESREGDVVRGSYSLTEPDGSRRIVEYSADDVNGFQAIVHKEPSGVPSPTVAHAPTPVLASAPVIAKDVKSVSPYQHYSTPIQVGNVPFVPGAATYLGLRSNVDDYPFNSPYYSGYVHPYAAYNHVYSPYQSNHLTNHYNHY